MWTAIFLFLLMGAFVEFVDEVQGKFAEWSSDGDERPQKDSPDRISKHRKDQQHEEED